MEVVVMAVNKVLVNRLRAEFPGIGSARGLIHAAAHECLRLREEHRSRFPVGREEGRRTAARTKEMKQGEAH